MKKIQVCDSFIILLALMLLLDTDGTMRTFLLAAAVHELGHYGMLKLFGGSVQSFRLTAAGGLMRYHLPYAAVLARVLIAAAGPAAGLLAAAAVVKWGKYQFAGANILLSMVNLIPVMPLDGGVILKELVRPEKAIRMIERAVLVLCFLTAAGLYINGKGLGMLVFTGFLAVNHRKNLQNRLC